MSEQFDSMLSLRDLIFSQETPSQSQPSFQTQPPTQNQSQQSSIQSQPHSQNQSQQKSQSSSRSQPLTQNQSQQKPQLSFQSQPFTQSQLQQKRSISQPQSSSLSRSQSLSQTQLQQKHSISQPHSNSNGNRRASSSTEAQPGYDSDDYADLENQCQRKETDKFKRKGSKYLNDTPLLYKGKRHVIIVRSLINAIITVVMIFASIACS